MRRTFQELSCVDVVITCFRRSSFARLFLVPSKCRKIPEIVAPQLVQELQEGDGARIQDFLQGFQIQASDTHEALLSDQLLVPAFIIRTINKLLALDFRYHISGPWHSELKESFRGYVLPRQQTPVWLTDRDFGFVVLPIFPGGVIPPTSSLLPFSYREGRAIVEPCRGSRCSLLREKPGKLWAAFPVCVGSLSTRNIIILLNSRTRLPSFQSYHSIQVPLSRILSPLCLFRPSFR